MSKIYEGEQAVDALQRELNDVELDMYGRAQLDFTLVQLVAEELREANETLEALSNAMQGLDTWRGKNG